MNKVFLGSIGFVTLATIALVVSNNMGLDWPPKASPKNIIVSTQTPAKQAKSNPKKMINRTLHASTNTGLSQQKYADTSDQADAISPAANQGTQNAIETNSDSNTQNITPAAIQDTSTNANPTSTPNDSNDTITPTQALQSIDPTNPPSNNQNRQESNPGINLNTVGLPISLGL